jgi:hypothetical protein
MAAELMNGIPCDNILIFKKEQCQLKLTNDSAYCMYIYSVYEKNQSGGAKIW